MDSHPACAAHSFRNKSSYFGPVYRAGLVIYLLHRGTKLRPCAKFNSHLLQCFFLSPVPFMYSHFISVSPLQFDLLFPTVAERCFYRKGARATGSNFCDIRPFRNSCRALFIKDVASMQKCTWWSCLTPPWKVNN